MAEWLRPGLWEVLTIKLRGIEPGQILITKKPTGEGGAKSRPLVTVVGVSQISGVRMAEWLRPGLCKVLTIKLRGIKPGQILITKKPTGEGLRSLVTVAGIDQMFRGSGWPSGYGRGFGRYSRLSFV